MAIIGLCSITYMGYGQIITDIEAIRPNQLGVDDIIIGTGKAAINNAQVQRLTQLEVRYIGTFIDGKVFDANTEGEPFKFTLGQGQVIKGWDLGVLGMKEGGKRKLSIPSFLAYGKRGYPPIIPPNCTLYFQVTLLKVT